MQQPMKTLSLEEARTAIKEAVALFELPENSQKMLTAKAQAGTDLMKVFTLLVPTANSIVNPVLAKYGYPETPQGSVMFTTAILQHKSTDPEIDELSKKLQAQFMPDIDVKQAANMFAPQNQ